jgi:hypothetical protein
MRNVKSKLAVGLLVALLASILIPVVAVATDSLPPTPPPPLPIIFPVGTDTD